jgi:hypothetical protein
MEPRPEFANAKARARALEDAFFAERDRQLIESLQRKLTAEEKQRVLASAVGISESRMLQAVTGLESGVQVSIIAALMPLIEVAWCDGEVSPKEREAILRAAREMDIPLEPVLQQLLEKWLEKKPSAAAVTAWKEYLQALCRTLDASTRVHLREAIIGRAQKVAAAAGGFLGLGSKVSAAEQACLDEMTQTFNG